MFYSPSDISQIFRINLYSDMHLYTSVYCLPDEDVYNILTCKQHCPVLFPLVKFTQDQIGISVTH